MRIRELQPTDVESVVELSLRAWEPVFVSIRRSISADLYEVFYPDGWSSGQRDAVEAVCTDERYEVWVAEEGNRTVGFVAVRMRPEDELGEIYMIAVDPDSQDRGYGRALTGHALAAIEEAGLPLAMVETGADPGHAPARRLYERSGFDEMRVARYFKKLG